MYCMCPHLLIDPMLRGRELQREGGMCSFMSHRIPDVE